MVNTLATAPNEYRGENGRFLRGNPGGPGSPHSKQVAQLRAALFESLTREDIWAVMRKMRDRALDGDVPAARLLLEYSIGRPPSGCTAGALDAELTGGVTEKLLAERLTPDELTTLLKLYEKARGGE